VQSPYQLTGTIESKSRLNQWALFGILVAMGLFSFFGWRPLLKASGAGSGSGNALAQTIKRSVDEVAGGITNYTNNHDAAALEKINAEGKEMSRLVGDLKNRLSATGKDDAASQIEQAYQALREATINLLSADQEFVKGRQALIDSRAELSSVLDTMESSIRNSQMNASGRMRAVRLARSEFRNPSQTDGRFNRAINAFEMLSRTRRAARWADQAKTYFAQGLGLSADLEHIRARKEVALARFTQKRLDLEKILKDTPEVHTGGAAGPFAVAINVVLVLGAAFLLYRNARRTDRDLTRPLQDIIQCVEAAAAGDVSRVPDHWSGDEVGQLSQAVGRLITVLARSENLVFHLAALVESSGDAIISHSLDGKILSWNKGAQRIYGYSAEEVKGRMIDILSPQDGAAKMMEKIRKVRNGDRIHPFETSHQARNGRSVRVLVRVAAIFDSTRKVIGASFIAQDLSDIGPAPSKIIEDRQTA